MPIELGSTSPHAVERKNISEVSSWGSVSTSDQYSAKVTESRRILLVDSDPQPGRGWISALASAGFEVECLSEEYIEKYSFDGTRFSLGIAHRASAEIIRHQAPLLPLILVREPQMWGGIDLRVVDADEVITQPFEPQELVHRVKEVMEAYTQPVSLLDDSLSEVLWPNFGKVDDKGEISGQFCSRYDFLSLLGTLVRREYTGWLVAQKKSIKKRVYFQRGRPILIHSNRLSESLGQQMIKQGLISKSICDLALKSKKRCNTKFGQTLINMGEISSYNLLYALQSQLMFRLYDLFSWRTGHYYTAPGEGAIEGVELPFALEEVIYEGLQTRVETASLLKMLYPLRYLKFSVSGHKGWRVARELDPETWSLIVHSHYRSIAQMLSRPKLDRAKLSRLLVTLGLTGQLRLWSSDRVASPGYISLGRGLVFGTIDVRCSPQPTTGLDSALCEDSIEAADCYTPAPPPRGLCFNGLHTRFCESEELLEEDDDAVSDLFTGVLAQPCIPAAPELRETTDLEAEPLAYERLRERYASVIETSFYDRLGLTLTEPSQEAIQLAYLKSRAALEEDLRRDARRSGRCAHLAESALVALEDARAVLLHDDTRRRLSQSSLCTSPAWLRGLEAFEHGVYLLNQGMHEKAAEQFETAWCLDSTVAEYREHATACRTHEGQHYVARLIRARNFRGESKQTHEAWQDVLKSDPDCPFALYDTQSKPEEVSLRSSWLARF